MYDELLWLSPAGSYMTCMHTYRDRAAACGPSCGTSGRLIDIVYLAKERDPQYIHGYDTIIYSRTSESYVYGQELEPLHKFRV